MNKIVYLQEISFYFQLFSFTTVFLLFSPHMSIPLIPNLDLDLGVLGPLGNVLQDMPMEGGEMMEMAAGGAEMGAMMEAMTPAMTMSFLLPGIGLGILKGMLFGNFTHKQLTSIA